MHVNLNNIQWDILTDILIEGPIQRSLIQSERSGLELLDFLSYETGAI